MSVPIIRPAQAKDASAIATLYNHYVENSPATLQEIPATTTDFEQQIAKANSNAPFIVAEIDSKILGYAYADIMKSRCGYRYTYENSIYVDPTATGRKIGSKLMQELLKALQKSPAHKVVAVISLPNEESIRLHERHGFKYCGTLPGVGWKFGEWVDCGYWVLALKEGMPG